MLGDGLTGQLLLEGAIGRAEERPGVAGGELALGHEALDGRGQLQQAHGVGDRRAALADPGGDVVVGEAEVLDQLLEGGRLLERGRGPGAGGSRPAPARPGRGRRSCGRWPGWWPGRPGGRPASAARRRSAGTARPRPRARGSAAGRPALGSKPSARRATPRRTASGAGPGWARCAVRGMSRRATSPSSASADAGGISEARPLPRPLRRAIADLPRQLLVGDRAP